MTTEEPADLVKDVSTDGVEQQAINKVVKNGPLSDVVRTATETTQSLAMGSQPLEAAEIMRGPLLEKAKSSEEIVAHLQHLILLTDDCDGEDGPFPSLDEPAKMAVVASSLAAFITTLNSYQLRKLSTQIVSDTTLWISSLFRFFEASATFHEDPREGLLRMCRVALHVRYPRYAAEGYEALYARPPVCYISAAAKSGLGQFICTQLGLPVSCLSYVPGNTVFGSHHRMDLAALDKMIGEDIAAQRVPLIVLAYAGTPQVGHVDNLQRLQEICKTNNIWLHVEGHSLAALCLVSAPNLPAHTGDSMTLCLGPWLGIPPLPCVTLYRSPEATITHSAGLSSPNPMLKMNCFPLWITLQSLGRETIVNRIKQAFEFNKYLETKLRSFKRIKQVSLSLSDNKNVKSFSVANVMAKSMSTSFLFEVLPPTTVFQYISEKKQDDLSSKNPFYFDNLNSWLGQILQRDVPAVPVDIIDVEGSGFCIRFCPLEVTSKRSVTQTDLDHFITCIYQQLDILNATVVHKVAFIQQIEECSNLQLVELDNWAGLGAVRYVPQLWLARQGLCEDGGEGDVSPPSTPGGRDDINRLNIDLLSALKATDSAFSIGEANDGMVCIRFGMVTMETDVHELVSLVLSAGKEIEESSRFLETMTEIVKKGIETATEDLKKENEEKLWQEGILRHVPVVGIFVNWWSPPPPEAAGIKGRSLDLSAGVVESTENIYKYHMQIHHGNDPSSPDTKLPPMPSVQTPIKTSPQHSRSSSHSSTNVTKPTSSTESVPVVNSA